MWMDDFRRRTRWNAHANERRYTAPADPFELVEVDPTTVERYAPVSLKWGLNRVRGDWDRSENCQPLDDFYIYAGIIERFEQGQDWEETVYYEHLVERVEDGGFRGCETVEEIEEEILPAIEGMYEDMRENGYRTNLGVVYDDVEDFEYIHDLEPLVLIDRDGEVLWSEGYHRLALACVTGIDTVPVYVIRRHEKWQQVRDAVAKAGDVPPEYEAYADHPDLQDVLES